MTQDAYINPQDGQSLFSSVSTLLAPALAGVMVDPGPDRSGMNADSW